MAELPYSGQIYVKSTVALVVMRRGLMIFGPGFTITDLPEDDALQFDLDMTAMKHRRKWTLVSDPDFPYTILPTDYCIGVYTDAPHTVLLPAFPVDGDEYQVYDITGNGAAANITVDGNGHTIDAASPHVITTNYGGVTVRFEALQNQWYVIHAKV